MNVYNMPQDSALVWVSASGTLYLEDAVGLRIPLARGYSGAPGHINRPDDEHLQGRGPIPRGRWLMDAPADRPSTGPVSIGLEAQEAATAKGRSAFFIHGDNKDGNGTASRGCIILNRRTRDLIVAFYWAGWRILDVE